LTRLRIDAASMTFVAETHPGAPRTVAAFLALLPYRQRLIHVKWSGDLLFYPGGYSETEILLAYGPCSFASKMGPLAGNHFLTIVEGRKQLKELGRRVLWEGAQDIVISTMM